MQKRGPFFFFFGGGGGGGGFFFFNPKNLFWSAFVLKVETTKN